LEEAVRPLSITLLTALPLLAGCATLMNGSVQAVNVQTTPAGAVCTLGDRKITTPGDMLIKKGGAPKRMKIVCELAGYAPATIELQEHGSAWVVANVFNGILPGVVIDGLSGGSSVYAPDRVALTLEAAR
jgi:hypothetical protein